MLAPVDATERVHRGQHEDDGREEDGWLVLVLVRGSATECAACLDSLVAKGACREERIEPGKSLLVRVVSMLSKLVDRFSPVTQAREDRFQYGIEDEDEDDDDGRAVLSV